MESTAAAVKLHLDFPAVLASRIKNCVVSCSRGADGASLPGAWPRENLTVSDDRVIELQREADQTLQLRVALVTGGGLGEFSETLTCAPPALSIATSSSSLSSMHAPSILLAHASLSEDGKTHIVHVVLDNKHVTDDGEESKVAVTCRVAYAWCESHDLPPADSSAWQTLETQQDEVNLRVNTSSPYHTLFVKACALVSEEAQQWTDYGEPFGVGASLRSILVGCFFLILSPSDLSSHQHHDEPKTADSEFDIIDVAAIEITSPAVSDADVAFTPTSTASSSQAEKS